MRRGREPYFYEHVLLAEFMTVVGEPEAADATHPVRRVDAQPKMEIV